MTRRSLIPLTRARRFAGAAALFFASLGAAAQAPVSATGAAALRASYADLGEQLRQNAFGRPLVMNSEESPNDLKGDIYAVIDYPFATVSRALNDPGEWCDVLILHLNTKYCRTAGKGAGAVISVAVGKKFNQPLNEAHRVEFAWRPAVVTADYMEIQLDAPTGPLGTSNYRIALQVIPIDGGRSFMHLRYSYSYGFAGRVAMKAYLGTVASDKVGFTRSGGGYIGGVRGVVERNTMRYYLAIDAYLSALSTPLAGRLDKRLQTWFTATERYARQLHEIDREEYIEMKLSEVQRQQTPQ